MKSIISFLDCGLIVPNINAFSQTLSDGVAVTGLKRGTTLKEQTPIQLFKDYKYKIAFSFNNKWLASDDAVLFEK